MVGWVNSTRHAPVVDGTALCNFRSSLYFRLQAYRHLLVTIDDLGLPDPQGRYVPTDDGRHFIGVNDPNPINQNSPPRLPPEDLEPLIQSGRPSAAEFQIRHNMVEELYRDFVKKHRDSMTTKEIYQAQDLTADYLTR